MKIKTTLSMIAVLLAALTIMPQATTATGGNASQISTAVPDSLTAAEWESIQSQISAAEYQFMPVENSYAAPNRVQGWQTTFGPAGAQVNAANGDWNWGLTLTGYGYGDSMIKLADFENLSAFDETVTYQWDSNLSEWWFNSPVGLEQGFTLQQRPRSLTPNPQSPLLLKMAVSGSLTPVMDNGDILFQDSGGKTILRYDQLHVIDANGQTIPASLSPSPHSISILIDDAAAVYPLTIDPWLQQAKLTAADAAVGDYFGHAVAVSGDTAIVGAYLDDDDGNASGSAYVFIRSGTAWSQQTKLTAADAAAEDRFGFSVAVSGDTAVVGAYRDSDSGLHSGSAYVFTRRGTAWSQQVKLTAADADQADLFGFSVAVSGDTAVVGAYRDEDNGNSSGSAYVFTRSGTAWSQQAKLTAADAAAHDLFGFSVAVSGDTAVVGAHGNDDDGSASGSTYVFTRSGTIWSDQRKLTALDAAARDYFGFSVAVSGDTVVIGAYGDDDGGSASGSAYVFTRRWPGWRYQKLVAFAAAGDNFGRTVAVSGDTVVIGAYGDDDGGSASGSAHVYSRHGIGWGYRDKLTALDAAADDNFGFSVAVSGDTAVIGAYLDDDGGLASGSAYVFISCIASAQSGAWATGATWVGGVAPTSADGACVNNGHTVTLGATAAADSLWVWSGGVLDLSTYSFTVEYGTWNYGTMQQTRNVGASSAVNFLQIQPNGGGIDRYRGVDIVTDAGNDLGAVTVHVMGNTSVCNNNDGGAYRNRCFMINPVNAGTASITLHSVPGEDDISDDAFFQYASSTTWTQGAACADGGGVGGACTGAGTFASPAWFLVGNSGNTPTAVSLQSIYADAGTAVLPVAMVIVMLLLMSMSGTILHRRHR